MSLPLVTAIMPTIPGRIDLYNKALESFRWQTYRESELIEIRDDYVYRVKRHKTQSLKHELLWVGGKASIGAKRNAACASARGDIIIHWDDDDWSAPDRIETQVNHLLMAEQPVVGFNKVLFADDANRKAWLYNGAEHYAIGSSFCYWKRAWQEHPFEDRSCGEDNAFIQACGGVNSMATNGLLVCRIHPGNTSTRVGGSAWIEQPWSVLEGTGYESVA